MRRTENDLIRRTRRVVLATVALLAFCLVAERCLVAMASQLRSETAGCARFNARAFRPQWRRTQPMVCPPFPDRENAALVMTQAFALMRTFPDQRSNEVSRFKSPRADSR